LGRGPGASRQGAVSLTPPLPETGAESPDSERRALRDGDAAAERVGDFAMPPLPEAGAEPSESGRRVLRDGEEAGDGPSGRDAGEEGPEGTEAPRAASVAPADVADSPTPPLSEPGAESPDPERRALRDGDAAAERVGDFPTRPLPEAESPEPEPRALRDGEEAGKGPFGTDGNDDGPADLERSEAAPAVPSVAQGVSRTGPGSEAQHGASVAAGGGDGRFTVRLVNFEGPFDLLLQLISKHKLDVTEVALSKVTDEFMAYIRAMGPDWDLDQTTEFLVVAATLLDLKAARLLPAAEVEDEADLALLEARDLLFARLLQYRAYKQIADIFDRRLDEEARRYPRTVGLEAHLAELLPEVVISVGAEGFAKLAVKAMQPKAKPQVYVDHIHAPLVSVREQAEVVVAMLRERGRASFRELSQDAPDTLTVVARFLALLELYREKAVALDQEEALGELTVVWAGGGAEAVAVTDEFDQVVEEKQ
jgi:segregation and condensation protein A